MMNERKIYTACGIVSTLSILVIVLIAYGVL